MGNRLNGLDVTEFPFVISASCPDDEGPKNDPHQLFVAFNVPVYPPFAITSAPF